jgi:hypothetical protein
MVIDGGGYVLDYDVLYYCCAENIISAMWQKTHAYMQIKKDNTKIGCSYYRYSYQSIM